MVYNPRVQCDYKLKIDLFEVNEVSVVVFITPTKQKVKQYCKDTKLPFKEGVKNFLNFNFYNHEITYY